MKIKNLIIIILVILLSTSLYFNLHKQKTSDTETENISKITADTLFTKKQECQRYKTQTEKTLEENNITNPETGLQTYNALEKIFYSPKENSCLYVAVEWYLINKKKETEIWVIADVLTNELLISSALEWNGDNYLTKKQEFENYLEEYEN